MHYDDLTPCTYFGDETEGKLLAVGWLEGDQPYTRGAVSTALLDRLFELLAKPWNRSLFLGYHECSLCDLARYRLTHNGRTVSVGNQNLFVPGDGLLYVAPSLIVHYILAHGYAPPHEFCDAVLRCPPMSSPEYFQAIAANGPGSYAAVLARDTPVVGANQ
jgi:hypothetical protein